MNCSEANSIPIDIFLSSLGFEPVKTRAHAKWYLSPLRAEKTASFKVDTQYNRWYDFGIGAGGDLVNLGRRLSNLSVSDFLAQMATHKLAITVHIPQPAPEPVAEWKIISAKQISHPALVAYLKQRCIPLALANTFCSEVHYTNDKQVYYAIGIRNDSEGYEVRNKTFKGCIGSKDITTLPKQSNELVVFEGFFDFLSAQRVFESTRSCSTIILNSITQVEKAIQRIETLSPERIECYLNNDDGGKRCIETIRTKFPRAINCSALFQPFNDINDLLKSKNGIHFTP